MLMMIAYIWSYIYIHTYIYIYIYTYIHTYIHIIMMILMMIVIYTKFIGFIVIYTYIHIIMRMMMLMMLVISSQEVATEAPPDSPLNRAVEAGLWHFFGVSRTTPIDLPSGYLTVCYWKWPFIDDLLYLFKMVIFHSYVGLPEGILVNKYRVSLSLPKRPGGRDDYLIYLQRDLQW